MVKGEWGLYRGRMVYVGGESEKIVDLQRTPNSKYSCVLIKRSGTWS